VKETRDRHGLTPSAWTELKAIVQELIGQKCWAANLSYGAELYLDCGAKRQYQVGPMAGREFGAWQFYARATSWVLTTVSGGVLTTKYDDPPQVRETLKALAERSISDVNMTYPDMAIALQFDNQITLQLAACPQSDETDPAVAGWELYTPDARCLEVWPGPRWALVPYETT
jgi:hypothetical protein